MEFDDKSRIKINILDIKDNITTEQKETKKQGKKYNNFLKLQFSSFFKALAILMSLP